MCLSLPSGCEVGTGNRYHFSDLSSKVGDECSLEEARRLSGYQLPAVWAASPGQPPHSACPTDSVVDYCFVFSHKTAHPRGVREQPLDLCSAGDPQSSDD